MLHFTSDQFVQWLGIYFWPMLRIMALISTAPILSEKSVPKRVKIGLGIVITIIVALPCRRWISRSFPRMRSGLPCNR